MPRRRLALLLAVVGAAFCAVVLVVVVGKGTNGEAKRRPSAVVLSEGVAASYWALGEPLEDSLADPSSDNKWIIVCLDLIEFDYLHPPPPPSRPLHVPRPGRREALRWNHGIQDLEAYAKEHGWPDEYVDEVREYRRAIEKLYLKALTLRQIDPDTGTNTRDAVNIRAAQVLAETGNADLSDDIIEALEKTLFKARYEVSHQLYDEAFAALGRLGDEQALAWLVDNYTELKRDGTRYTCQLNAAHKTMLLFNRDAVSSPLRYLLVSEMIDAYTPTEAQGSLGGWRLAAWAQHIGPDAIRATQHFAGDPVDDDGQPLDTMQELAEWFRDHDDPSKPPWTDE